MTKENWKERYGILIPVILKREARKKVAFIDLYRNNLKLTNMCTMLDISPKNFYKYRNTLDSDYKEYLMIKNI